MLAAADYRAEARTIEEVLASWREDAAVLRRTGHDHDAELLDRVLTDVARATEAFRTWLSEADARLQSGRGRDYFRARRAEWAAAGHARRGPHGWEYRQCVVPQRVNLALAREAGRRGERVGIEPTTAWFRTRPARRKSRRYRNLAAPCSAVNTRCAPESRSATAPIPHPPRVVRQSGRGRP